LFVLLTLGITLSGCATSDARTESAAKPDEGVAPTDPEFPDAWIGSWRGTCVARYPDGRRMAFPMELHVRPLDDPQRWSWTLVYGAGAQRQERPYQLVCLDADAGHYAIDEQNSIVIDAYHIGADLVSMYQVQQSLMIVVYTRTAEGIEFALSAVGTGAPRTSGGEGEIPAVDAYPVQVMQRATLRPAD
jgi:hypothetical protein